MNRPDLFKIIIVISFGLGYGTISVSFADVDEQYPNYPCGVPECIYELKIQNQSWPITYQMWNYNFDNSTTLRLDSITSNVQEKSLKINLTTDQKGEFIIYIPKKLLNTDKDGFEFTVLVNEKPAKQETDYYEPQFGIDSDSRQLAFHINNNTKVIKIIGEQMLSIYSEIEKGSSGTVYADEEFSGMKKEILRTEHEAYPLGRNVDFQTFEWSPDGKSIAFLKWESCSEEFCMPFSFWIMNSDGKEIKKIDLSAEYKIYNVNQWFLRFSPDGKYLLFNGIWRDEIKDRSSGLFKLNLQDKSLTLIVKDKEISSADWTPDGNIIYNEFLGGPEGILWYVDSNGNNPKLLYKSQPSFALIDVNPDGNRVLIRDFVGHKGPSTIPNPKIFDMQKNEIITIKIPYDWYNTLRWGPDGESIIYTVYKSSGGTDGKIILTSVNESNTQILFSSSEANIFDPAVSPDGKSLVFGIDYFNSTSFLASIYLIEPSKPIPEFPTVSMILVMAVIVTLVVTRTKWNHM